MFVEVLPANRPLSPFSMHQIIDSASVLISDIDTIMNFSLLQLATKNTLFLNNINNKTKHGDR
jgi:hypothetical protein